MDLMDKLDSIQREIYMLNNIDPNDPEAEDKMDMLFNKNKNSVGLHLECTGKHNECPIGIRDSCSIFSRIKGTYFEELEDSCSYEFDKYIESR